MMMMLGEQPHLWLQLAALRKAVALNFAPTSCGFAKRS